MNYEFSLSKTASISLVVGSVFISVLLFGAGLVVGSQWLVSASTLAETTAKNEKDARLGRMASLDEVHRR